MDRTCEKRLFLKIKWNQKENKYKLVQEKPVQISRAHSEEICLGKTNTHRQD